MTVVVIFFPITIEDLAQRLGKDPSSLKKGMDGKS